MVIDNTTPLVLGSSSPRRRQLLADLGLPLAIVAIDVDEAPRQSEAPEPYLGRVVDDKLAAAAERAGAVSGAALLVADTIVVLDGRILGKPADVGEAASLLGALVGRTHVVLTRYAIAAAPNFASRSVARTIESRVTMRRATDEEVMRYARRGEGLDKAGAYAAQGVGAFLVERIEGSYTNVVGLPVCEVVQDLSAQGLLGPFP